MTTIANAEHAALSEDRVKTSTRRRRVSGRPSELRVTIGGITTLINSNEPDLTLAAQGPIRRFVNPEAEPDIRVNVAWWDDSKKNPYVAFHKVFDSGGVWQLFRGGDTLVFELRSPIFGAAPYTTAVFSSDFTTGIVYLRRDCFTGARAIYPLQYPLDELLITNWLALGRGVEMHACAVVDADGLGYLFAGHSGAGKTTTARLWRRKRGVSVLSDDRVILRKAGDHIRMYGTPWHGDEPLASPDSAPLHRGFFLRHARENELTRVTGAQAVMELFSRSFPPFFSATGLDFTLSLLTDISKVVSFFALGFVPDQAVPDFVLAARP